MRLLEVVIPVDEEAEFDEIFSSEDIIAIFKSTLKNDRMAIKVLVDNEDAKDLLIELEKKKNEYRTIIYAVEGTLPKLSKLEEQEENKENLGKFISISKEELYDDIDKPVKLSLNFILMVVLSSIVAGIGILKNNQAIVIGAMVIAPFLGPNMALSFGTILGDLSIIKKSITTILTMIVIATAISVFWGLLSNETQNIETVETIDYEDIVLALTCGLAGVISIVSGQGSSLVGVTVAAALLPPLMRSGLLLGGAHFEASFNSILIFVTNVVSLNIAGVITFYLIGIRPSRLWEKEKAKKRTKKALFIWAIMLAVIISAVILLRYFDVLKIKPIINP